MKKLLSLCVVSLLIGMTTTTLSGSQDRGRNESIQKRFVGAWRLAWLEEEDAGGKIHRADCTRLPVYEFSGKELIVKSASKDEHWRVAWEHY